MSNDNDSVTFKDVGIAVTVISVVLIGITLLANLRKESDAKEQIVVLHNRDNDYGTTEDRVMCTKVGGAVGSYKCVLYWSEGPEKRFRTNYTCPLLEFTDCKKDK
jgi:hypothetical protein